MSTRPVSGTWTASGVRAASIGRRQHAVELDDSELPDHGELFTLGITVAPSTGWEILRDVGIDPARDRAAATWAAFLRCQAEALLAIDFIETVTLTGARMYILAVIEHVLADGSSIGRAGGGDRPTVRERSAADLRYHREDARVTAGRLAYEPAGPAWSVTASGYDSSVKVAP